MTDYDLISNDWKSVSLLYGEHLISETGYLEQVSRWGLEHGRAWGVIALEKDALLVSGTEKEYDVSLRACSAITRKGRIIEWQHGGAALSVQGSNTDHAMKRVPIYLGVGVQKVAFPAGGSQSGGIDERFLMQFNYKIAHTDDSPNYDWIQIGRMRREGPRFVLDAGYIPQCVHLRSCPAMRSLATEITRTAQRTLIAIEKSAKLSRDGTAIPASWKAMMGAYISAIAPAATLVDWEAHPRAYLERLAAVIVALEILLRLIDASDGHWVTANDQVRKAGNYLFGMRKEEGDAYWSPLAFDETPAEAGRPARYWNAAFTRIWHALRAVEAMFTQVQPGDETDDVGGTVIRQTTDWVGVRPT